ncbi:Inositol monophosphatase 2 [Trachymyrmex septentrionalis]|uniref:Inositol-1-monophosphatase n=1 Tax=Trachymyrmex septentrionalis TaxID=34720 RepID=A0A195ERM5_9HYME|nr:PREDICTED: inositol monophosphatase 1-like [Trachymyrmex septentrionalis]KYN30529.1 Inositol monophosphatase 2 [Trachymyrmex septentrionalis]
MCELNNFDEYYRIAEELVLYAGKIIEDGINSRKNIKSKGIDWDLVTEYDRKIEDKLIKQLSIQFPSHKFIGEETAAKEGCLPQLTNDPTWIIDPIDGTTNFVHRFPHTCISLALLVNKKVEIGIIYNPLMGQFFSARRHCGAFLNGKPIKTSDMRDISQSLVAMEPWLAKDPQYLASVYSRMHALVQGTHGIRSLGTAALTLCYVAMGAVEAYHIEGIDAWDVAAGKLIIEEAGGVVIDTDGGELDLMTPKVIAACNQQIAQQLVDLIKKADCEILNKNLN